MARDGITIVTNFAYTMNQLRSMNNISYLYNPNWNPEGDMRAGYNTLPMSLLMVTKEQEIGQSSVSSQQMIMYKGETTNILEVLSKSVYGTTTQQAQLNVIADNIVNQPKVYQIEALIPATYSSLIGNPFNAGYDPIFMTNPTEEDARTMKINENYAGREGSTKEDTFVSNLTAILINVFPCAVLDAVKLIVSLLSAAFSSPFGAGTEWRNAISILMNGSSYNKDSLEAMWQSRGLLKYKPSMEWNYKTVAITNYNISKNPTEDNCYRASITLQEVPIMSVDYFSGVPKRATSYTAGFLGKALRGILNVACTDIGN